MGQGHQLAALDAIDAGQVGGDADFEGEPGAVLEKTDVHRDGGVGQGETFIASRRLERRVKAPGVAGGEQLLRVGRSAGSALLFRGRQIKIQRAVVGSCVAVAAVTARDGRGSINDGHSSSPFSISLHCLRK